jgi:hypothetical protein
MRKKSKPKPPDDRIQLNFKVNRPQAEMLRQLARADGRTLTGYFEVHFLNRLTPPAAQPIPAAELSIN